MRVMFTHVEGLIRLLLVNPASSAISERSFSSLFKLKTYLRSTCNQQQLNHLAICQSYKDKLDKIIVYQLLTEFVAARESRATNFGKVDLD
jgi:hAT family C-terminal dimerisation region